MQREIAHTRGDQQITLCEVLPPDMPVREVTVVPNAETAIAPVASFNATQTEAKDFAVFGLFATLYPNGYTQLVWKHDGQEYKAWSRMDANLLKTITGFETPDCEYMFMLLVKDAEPNITEQFSPAIGQAKSWQLITGDPSNKEALSPIIALHHIYQKHKAELVQALQQRTDNASQLAAYRAQNPEPTKAPVIHFWNGQDRPLEQEEQAAE